MTDNAGNGVDRGRHSLLSLQGST